MEAGSKMVRNALLYLFALLCLSGILLPQTVSARDIPAATTEIQNFYAFNPGEFKRKMSDSFERFKEGLHPVVVVLVYVGLVFLGFILFTALVIFVFMLIMVFRRH